MIDERFRELLRRMPKVELHVHLEGAIRPSTLLDLARRRGVELPADDIDGIRRWFRFRDFEHFIEIYLTCSRCLREPEDFLRVASDFVEEQARQNILYTEAHFTIGTHLMNGRRGDEIRDALWEAVEEGERDHGVRVRWIPDIVRNVPWKWADRTIEWALDSRGHGAVALGLSGIEDDYPIDAFRAHFEAAREGGLGRTVHAGEQGGPESIRASLAVCNPGRIGHGVRAAEDPELVAELAEAQIALEVCPSSNVRLGVFPDLERHSFDELRRAGVVVTVNSDDPPLFETTLTDELERVAETWSYDVETTVGFVRAAADHTFLLPADRDELVRRLDDGIRSVRGELGL